MAQDKDNYEFNIPSIKPMEGHTEHKKKGLPIVLIIGIILLFFVPPLGLIVTLVGAALLAKKQPSNQGKSGSDENPSASKTVVKIISIIAIVGLIILLAPFIFCFIVMLFMG